MLEFLITLFPVIILGAIILLILAAIPVQQIDQELEYRRIIKQNGETNE